MNVKSTSFQVSDGDKIIGVSNTSMNHVVSMTCDEFPSAGTAVLSGRPFGRKEFIPIEGASNIALTHEFTYTVSYPVQELNMEITGAVGGGTMTITVASE